MNMRTAALMTATMLALVACGQSGPAPTDRELLVEACTSEGEAAGVCTCIASALENNLSADLYRKTAYAVGRDRVDMREFVSQLSDEEQRMFSTVLEDLFACAPTQPATE